MCHQFRQTLEGEQERGGKIEGITRTWRISPQTAEATTSDTMTTSVVEEVGNASSVGNNRTCSNGESREDRGSNGTSSTEGKVCSKKPIYHRHG